MIKNIIIGILTLSMFYLGYQISAANVKVRNLKLLLTDYEELVDDWADTAEEVKDLATELTIKLANCKGYPIDSLGSTVQSYLKRQKDVVSKVYKPPGD